MSARLRAPRNPVLAAAAAITTAAALALSAAPAAAGPMVLAYYAGYPGNYASLTTYYASFDAVSLDYYDITAKGIVTGNGDPAPADAIAFLRSKRIPAYGCVSNIAGGDWSPKVAHAAMTTARSTSIANLVAFAQANQFAGVKAGYMIGILGNDSTRDELVGVIDGIGNAAVRFVAAQAIDHLTPKGSKPVSDKLGAIIAKNAKSADREKAAYDAPLKQVMYRIDARN